MQVTVLQAVDQEDQTSREVLVQDPQHTRMQKQAFLKPIRQEGAEEDITTGRMVLMKNMLEDPEAATEAVEAVRTAVHRTVAVQAEKRAAEPEETEQ